MQRFSYLAVLLTLCVAVPAEADANPPAESVEKLQDIFRSVADGLWNANENAWHVGRHDICIELQRLIVEIDPGLVDAYSNAAWLMSSAGRDAEAIAMYRRGIAANPKTYRTHFDLGMHYYQKKDYLGAEANFAEATRHSAPSPVWKMLAHAREHLSQFEDALAAWDRVREMEPDDPVIERNVSRIQDAMGRKAAP